FGEIGNSGEEDLLLTFGVRIRDVQEEAASLQSLGELPGVVGGQDDEWPAGRRHGAELGYRHLEIRKHFEEQGLGLDLDPVDLVDQQHDRRLRPDRLEQRSSQQEVLREDVLFELFPLLVLVGLYPQELLLV